MKRMIPIIMGSNIDRNFAEKIGNKLTEFSKGYGVNLPFEYRIGSAHKTPEHVIEVVRLYDDKFDEIVYETVAGRSNALSGFVSAQTTNPVIACPPHKDKIEMLIDIWSSIRSPSNVYPMLVPGPKEAATAAISIFSMRDAELRGALEDYKLKVKEKIIDADKKLM